LITVIKSIFFDLDGTLFLSTPVLHSAYCRGVEEYNEKNEELIEPPSEQEVLGEVGNPVEEIYSNLFPGISENQQEELGRLILEKLLAEIRRKKGILIPGVEKTLRKLKNSFQLALVTNAQRDYMETVVNTYRLDRFLARQLCIQDVKGSSKAIIIEEMLSYFNLSSGQVVMVGDRESDYLAARAAETRFIGCDFGHAEEAELPNGVEKISEFEQLLFHPLLEANIDRK